MGIRGQRHAPAASAPGKRYDTRCTGSWLGLGIGLDGYRKCRPHRVSNLGSSSPVASCYKEYVISATFPTTNPLWTDLESNPGLPLSEAGEQPYEPWHCPSRMSHGTAPAVWAMVLPQQFIIWCHMRYDMTSIELVHFTQFVEPLTMQNPFITEHSPHHINNLNAFAKLQKATISVVISVSLYVCLSAWNNSAPTERIFVKFDMRIFRKIKCH
jgi:hypothetical protein